MAARTNFLQTDPTLLLNPVDSPMNWGGGNFETWGANNLGTLNGQQGYAAPNIGIPQTSLGAGGAPATGFNWDSLMDTKGAGGMALGAINTGVGAFNAWMGNKHQKFMQNYYGEQMALQKADFANNANSANEQLSTRASQRASNQGLGGTTKDAYVADYMGKWGAKTTV